MVVRSAWLVLALSVSAPAMAAIVVDGRLDEAEWAQAQRYDRFLVTEPFRLDPPPHGATTVAKLVSTPQGIAVAFEAAQPSALPRVKPRLQRDQPRAADRVNVSIDFDGDARNAYSFSVDLSGSIQDGVVDSERLLSLDWDTDWTWAVDEDEQGWRAELLIPWSVAPMRGSDSERRKVRVYFSRTLGASGEVLAYPAVSPERGRFVSGFEELEIAQYRASLLRVWPYLTARRDFVGQRSQYQAGLDLFWKPSPSFQLSAALNPDFGQVESDDLVISFDAVETFYSDKRPFFTENQSAFNLTTPDAGRLIHTRRIGAAADDGSGAAEIDAAVKLNGSLGRMGYGVLAASERGHAGRDFYAARLQYPLRPGLNLGWLGTYAHRPYLDREAQVQALDMNWRRGDELILDAQVLTSAIAQAGSRRSGQGAWLRINWVPSERWDYELEATHFGRDFDFNDLGFQRRGNLNELELTAAYEHPIAAPESRLAGTGWVGELMLRSNDSGLRLPVWLRLGHRLDFRSGNRLYLETNLIGAGWDDLISRGHGPLRRRDRYDFEATFTSRRYGAWAFEAALLGVPVGLGSRQDWTTRWLANWYPADTFNASLEFAPSASGDWLVWESGELFGRYGRRGESVALGMNWFPARKHELRLKSEWVAIRADAGRRYRLTPGGGLVATGETRPDFDVNSFGLQLRYRYEFGPQSELFLAYSRGGFRRSQRERGDTFDLLDDALALRDSDQLLAKLRYRF
ncbi:hypothetical protein DX914_13490 [Lysobacter silvisoli]|uniref:DUF5916 domain-containing protein n=1 Tax=Lysobacter silvisoli TaxID=2293254 RepID=A0A371K010_9GAMM|nr:hypothetical protein DX914_13490 [Lysobacter silvisoli]